MITSRLQRELERQQDHFRHLQHDHEQVRIHFYTSLLVNGRITDSQGTGASQRRSYSRFETAIGRIDGSAE